MFDYELIRLEHEERIEEARLAYFEFHFDDETEIDTGIDTEIDDKEIIFTIENF